MPTSSRSLCLPPARMHFWLFAARFSGASGELGSTLPTKMGLNWFMPAFAKSSVGSSTGTTGDDGQNVCSFVCAKKLMNVSRTFAAGPKALLMDEPFGALDAQTRSRMHELLTQVWRAHRATVLFITHDVDEALVLADRIHVMSPAPGRIVETLDLDQPRPRSAARFDEVQLAARARILDLLRGEPERLAA